MPERVENSVRQTLSSERSQHGGMRENIHRASDAQCRIELGTNSDGLVLVNQCDAVPRDSMADSRGLAVIQRHLSRTNGQLLEMLFADFVEADDLDMAGVRQFFQKIRILPLPLSPILKFAEHYIDDRDAVGQCLKHLPRAPARIHVYDRACIGNQESVRVSQTR
jgi:hypothetical protein